MDFEIYVGTGLQTFELTLIDLDLSDLSPLFHAMEKKSYLISILQIRNLPHLSNESLQLVGKSTSMKKCQMMKLVGALGSGNAGYAIESKDVILPSMEDIYIAQIKPSAVVFSNLFQINHSSFFFSFGSAVNKKMNVLLSCENRPDNLQDFSWSNKEIYPTFYQQIHKGRQVKIYLYYGPEYLSKDTLFFVQESKQLFIGSHVSRIEYGSLVSGKRLKTSFLGDYMEFSDNAWSDFFLQGNCVLIDSLRVCQLCLMHQYGLHRIYNNTATICASQINPDPSEMKKCYWEKPEPLQESLKGHDIDTSNLNLIIPVCKDLPQDVKDYLSKSTSSTSSISTFEASEKQTPKPEKEQIYHAEAQTLIAECYFELYILMFFYFSIFNFL